MSRLLLIAVLLFPSVGHAQEARTLYVGERRAVRVRSGPSTNHEILTNLKTGDAVELVRQVNDTYALVELPGGEQGYIASRYFTTDEPAAHRVRQLEAEFAAQTRELTRLREEMAQLQSARETGQHTSASYESRLAEMTAERDRLKRDASTAHFLAGAGVLLLGWLLGWTRLRLRRKTNDRLLVD